MEWIPTEKQLPPRGEWVIVHCPNSDGRAVRAARRRVDDDGDSTFTGFEGDDEFVLTSDDVPEWAPLPDPPTREGERLDDE